MSRRRVVVTGTGLLTPLGDRADQVHRALCAGDSGLRHLTEVQGEGVPEVEAGELTGFDAAAYLGRRGLRGMDRSSRLTAAAAHLALADGGRLENGMATGEVGLVLGTMLSGVGTTSRFDRRAVTAGPSYAKPMDFANTVINAAAGQAAIRLGLTGLNATISSGAASGPHALGYAVDLIRAGRADALLAGGMDELSWESLLALRGSGLLAGNGNGGPRHPRPCDRRRNGLAPGEAAAFLLLEEASAARARGARVLAEVRGHGAAFAPGTRGADGCGAESLGRALRLGLADAGVEPAAIDALTLSANGSPTGDRAEGFSLRSVLDGRLETLPVTAPKAALGESLGAAGAVDAILLIEALRAGVLPGVVGLDHADPDLPYRRLGRSPQALSGPCGLVSSRGFDGKSAVLVLTAEAAR